MDNENNFILIKEVTNFWNQWREDNPDILPNL